MLAEPVERHWPRLTFTDSADREQSPGSDVSDLPDDTLDDQEAEDPGTALVNPLVNGPPTFMSSSNGRMCAFVSQPLDVHV